MNEQIFIGIAIGVSVGIILAIVGAAATHLMNDEKHPKKKDIVFTKTCETAMQGMKDCVEAKIVALTDNVKTVAETTDKIWDYLINGKKD